MIFYCPELNEFRIATVSGIFSGETKITYVVENTPEELFINFDWVYIGLL
jgi:hypothetical protein